MGQVAYAAAVLADTPYIFGPFLEGGGATWADFSGNGQVGGWTPGGGHAGHSPYRCTGPGQGSYARYLIGGETWSAALTAGALPVDNLTLELWFRLEQSGVNETAIYVGNGGADGYGLLVDGVGASFKGLLGGVGFLASSAATLAQNVWSMLTLRRSATVWSYLVNGAVDTANAGTTAPNAPSASIAGGSGTIQQIVCNPSLYTTALSNARIAAHYAAMLVPEPGGAQQLTAY